MCPRLLEHPVFSYKILNLQQLFVLDLPITDSVNKLFVVKFAASPKLYVEHLIRCLLKQQC